MASTDEEEADVYFTLKTKSASGLIDVAQGHVNLKEMLAKEGRDGGDGAPQRRRG